MSAEPKPLSAPLCVNVRLDGKLFWDFAMFDAFVYLKRWWRPSLFAVLLTVPAIVCYTMPGGILLGTILLVIGWGMPAVYFGNYFYSVRKQTKKYSLADGRPVYTLEFWDAEDGVRVQSGGGKQQRLRWADCVGLYRRKGCSYLYTAPRQAYILPDAQAAGCTAQDIWALAAKHLPADKLHGHI